MYNSVLQSPVIKDNNNYNVFSGLDDSCLVDSDCSDAVNGSVCVSAKCSCAYGFHRHDNVCTRLACKHYVVTIRKTSINDTLSYMVVAEWIERWALVSNK